MPDVTNRNRRNNGQFDKEPPKPVGKSVFGSDMEKPKAGGWWQRRGENKEAPNDTHTYSENISRTLLTRYRDGVLHCDDKPAIAWSIGEEKWYHDGVLDRKHGPAVIEVTGAQKCYRDGVMDSDNEPTLIEADGTRKWYRNGVLHRDDGPAVIEATGAQKWYRNGVLDCDHGPAVIEADGTRKWYRDGVLHCDDGPAVIEADGTRKWYYLGKQYTKSGFEQLIKDKEMLQCMDDVNSATQPMIREGDE